MACWKTPPLWARTCALRWQRELGSLPGVKEMRGQGLMLGIELTKPCGVLIGRAPRRACCISVTADTVIRLVPPLILTTAEADEMVANLTPLVQHLAGR